MKTGFTLLEALIAVVVTGVVLAIGLPRLGDLRDWALVRSAAAALRSAHSRARVLAVADGRTTLLIVRPDSILVSEVSGPDTLLRWSAPGPQAGGVMLTGPTRPFTFAPIGISIGVSNATYTLTRGSATRQVVISRYGRVRIQ